MHYKELLLLIYISAVTFHLVDAGFLNTTGLTAQQKRYAQLYWDYSVASRVIRARNASISSNSTGALPPRPFSTVAEGRSPAYNHGYKFMIPLFERLSGLSYIGHAARLRYALERARAGEALRVGVLGGSISQGAGAGGPYRTYATLYKEWLNAALPPTFTTHKDKKRRSVLEAAAWPGGGVQAAGDVPRSGGSAEGAGSDAGGGGRDGPFTHEGDDEWGTALAESVERALHEAAKGSGTALGGLHPGQDSVTGNGSRSRGRRRLRNFYRRWPLERTSEGLAAGQSGHGDGGSLGRQLMGDLQQQEQQQQRIGGRVQEGTEEGARHVDANTAEDGGGGGDGGGGRLPVMHRLANGAVPGTVSSYMASCMQYHLPLEEVDIVLVEYAVNDRYVPSKDWQDDDRRAFERLVRKLLRLPRAPAVVLVNMFAFQSTGGRFWKNAERDFHELAMYYGLPSVSLKAAVLPSAAGEVSTTAPELDPGAIFTGGQVHPGMGGHVVVAELLITLSMELLRADHHLALLVPVATAHRQRQRDLKSSTTTTSATVTPIIHTASISSANNATQAAASQAVAAAGVVAASSSSRVSANLAAAVEVLRRVAARPLPTPMADDNWDTGATTCYLGQDVQALAVTHNSSGWTFTDEGRGKWGWVATEEGSSMQLKVSTQASRDVQRSKRPVVVQVAYLQSYHAMGAVRLSCVAGCECKNTTLDAFSDRQASVTVLSDVQVSQHTDCVLELTAIGPGGGEGGGQEGAGGTAGGGGAAGGEGGRRRCRKEKATCRGSRFKLVGLVVGEEPGSSSGSINWVRGQTLGGAASSRRL